MKLVYIGNKLSAYGFTPTGVEYLGELLREGGHEVVQASDIRNTLARLFHMVVTIIRNPDAKVVLIDTYSSSAFYFALICGYTAFLLRQPFILILRGGDLPTRISRNPGLVKGLFRKAASVVSVSLFLQKSFDTFFSTRYIPNTIPLSQYAFKKRKLVRPKLLWVRSLHSVYNPSLALKVLKLLSLKYEDASLTMVGPDKEGLLDNLRQEAHSLGIYERVSFTGKLSKREWIGLSEKSDVFINTTHFDNMPVSVIEAMALGLPVVSTSVGGVPFLISHEVNGMLVPDANPEAMMAAIDRLIQEPDLVLTITVAARQRAALFDSSIVLSQWNKLLDEVV
jgi:glycosyltransferase involved in cell wall biosynthesis